MQISIKSEMLFEGVLLISLKADFGVFLYFARALRNSFRCQTESYNSWNLGTLCCRFRSDVINVLGPPSRPRKLAVIYVLINPFGRYFYQHFSSRALARGRE